MVSVVVITFFLSWLPLYAIFSYVKFSEVVPSAAGKYVPLLMHAGWLVEMQRPTTDKTVAAGMQNSIL